MHINLYFSTPIYIHMPSPANSFSIYKNNILNCDSHGNASASFGASDLPIPTGVISGAPSNLHDLVSQVGANAVTMSYYAQANGKVSSHDCWATYTLYVQGRLSDGTSTSKIGITRTSNDPGKGGSVSTNWQALTTNTNAVITYLGSQEDCNGSGCGCKFESKGGWDGVSISLRIDVTVDLMTYCTKGQNIYQDMCYNYISDYITGVGPTQQISDYMATYCNTKYPSGTLSMFNDPTKMDSKDYQICACNMPDQDYQQFYQSIEGQFPNLDLGSIPANCLLPACVTSPFKSNKLNGCPIPQCLEIVNIDNSNIAGPVTVNQGANCTKYGIQPSPPGTPAAPGTLPPAPYSPPSAGPPSQPSGESFISRYRWWIVGAFVILVLLLIILLTTGKKGKGKRKVIHKSTTTTKKIKT
ncbi:mg777 protein [Tupanvirus deep ocean]|uniref:Mg777 protein n=1 Tax=Tupanvirus soda lake TaxID=2126985 RepID=A0AC59HBL8_9VIRU|nr:mg777 protein [Tupanvirus deep ocean]AUL78745.2 mg777 protein [Tupanvirus deep ocean]